MAPPAQRTPKCHVCGQSQKDTHELHLHIDAKHPKEKFPCSKCNDTFYNKQTLYKHMDREHADPKLKCEVCGYLSADKPLHAKHMRQHDAPITISCAEPSCNWTFTTQSGLNTHMERVHSSPNRCPEPGCGKFFETKSTLRYHADSAHTGDFPCPEPGCKHTYGHPSSLRQHVLVHIPELDTKCRFCGKSFGSKKAALANHINSTHFMDVWKEEHPKKEGEVETGLHAGHAGTLSITKGSAL